MILDANVLIALLDDQDLHHERAVDLVATAAQPLGVHEMTLAEALVLPARIGQEETAARAFADLGIRRVPTDDDFALTLARIRASSGLRMPDAVVLAAAERGRCPLATFDARLARAAATRGIETVPSLESH